MGTDNISSNKSGTDKPATRRVAVRFEQIDESSEGQRLDNFLLKSFKRVPKSKLYRTIRKGEVRINKGRCKPETRLKKGDVVRIPPLYSEPQDNQITNSAAIPPRLVQQLRDAILFEDDGLLVINKPHGIAVHGGSGLSFGVIEILRATRKESRFLELVHRLDRETSGVLMLAKSRSVLVELHSMLQTKRVQKVYHAWVYGKWPSYKPVVTAPLRKNVLKSGERMVVVAKNGKPSETTFESLTYLNSIESVQAGTGLASECSLVKVSPITGRTHQIRVHCQFAGHPILGDEKYCSPEINQQYRSRGLSRMCLHAHSLVLDWSGRQTQMITAPWALEDSPIELQKSSGKRQR